MSRGKKVTQQTLIGEAGIALIHERVTEMGFLFHPRRVDHGIDGHIDLVDPGTRDVLNLVLLVQSKASTMPFPYENAGGFQYTCDERDLNYWLSGNAPVILVLSHPDQRKAWWVDIKAELSDPKLRATRTVRVDKHRQIFDASAAQALLGRAVPKNSGLFLASPPKRETLTSNLLRVENLPAVLHIAPAAVTTYPAAGELLARERGADGGGWILRDGLVISFSDLTEAPLRVLCSGDSERHDTVEWSQSDDLDTLHRFMHLLSRTVGADCRADLRWHKERSHLHFRATRDLAPRREGRGPGRPGRTVFGPYYSKMDPAKISFYRHAALVSRFRRIGGTWYCQLAADYCFTRDGYQESAFADSLLAKIKRLDRHAAVAGWTRTWANYLSRQQSLFDEHPRSITFGELAAFEVDRGIEDKLWGPAPAGAAEERSDSTAEQAGADAVLAAAGIATRDLLSMLADDDPEQSDIPDTVPTQRRPRQRRKTDTGEISDRGKRGGQ